MEELLSLKWNNHRTTFLHILAVLRDKQLYTDATLACDGKIYPVHKLVLSTCSDYFSAMLDRTSCKNPIIVLKDIRSEDLEALLDYMYLGEVNVRQSDLSTLIKAAECLRVKGLAVADDEPPPRKSRTCDNQTRRGDTSGSPPAKRKRRSDVDDGRDDVRPSRLENRHASPVHNSTLSRPKTPNHSPSSSTSIRNNSTNSHSNTNNNNNSGTSISNSTSNIKAGSDGSSATNTNNEGLEPAPCVKVEIEEDEQDVISGGGGDGSNALGDNAGDSNTGDLGDNFNLSSEDFKEEDDNDGGDLGTDLPEFLQQATANYSHSSFAGTSFQPDLSWQGSGDSGGAGGGLTGNFGAAAGHSFGSSQQQDGTSHGATAGRKPASPDLHTATAASSSSLSSPPAHSDCHRGGSSPPSSLLSDLDFGSSSDLRLQQLGRGQRITAEDLKHLDLSFLGDHSSGGSAGDSSMALLGTQQPSASGGSFLCPVCGRYFARSWHLKRHMNIHLAIKPYNCPYCPHSANVKSNLQVHIRNIHGNVLLSSPPS